MKIKIKLENYCSSDKVARVFDFTKETYRDFEEWCIKNRSDLLTNIMYFEEHLGIPKKIKTRNMLFDYLFLITMYDKLDLDEYLKNHDCLTFFTIDMYEKNCKD